jgi:hypothetical protein
MMMLGVVSVSDKVKKIIEVDVVMVVLGVTLGQFAEFVVEVVVMASVLAKVVDGGERVTARETAAIVEVVLVEDLVQLLF